MSKKVINIDLSKLVFIAPHTQEIDTGKCLIGDDDSNDESKPISHIRSSNKKVVLKPQVAIVKPTKKINDATVVNTTPVVNATPVVIEKQKLQIKTKPKPIPKIEPKVEITEEEIEPEINYDIALSIYPQLQPQKFLIHKLVAQLSPQWQRIIFSYKDFDGLCTRFQQELDNFPKTLKYILPYDHNLIFNAFKLTQFPPKVIILGQDPYHSDIDQAMGLSFSVPDGVHPPPSLYNIFKELQTDIDNFKFNPDNGNLTKWAEQGVLLLNTALTVQCKTPGSHYDIWDKFINHILNQISGNGNMVFMLWGNPAKARLNDIKNKDCHLILQSVHPSPLSAMRGWFGCKHFSKANEFLIEKNLGAITWSLKE